MAERVDSGGKRFEGDVAVVSSGTVTVSVVLPVLNEEKVLRRSVETLREFLITYLPYEWGIIIADNGSTDQTLNIAQELMAEYENIETVYLSQRGRGRALKQAWIGNYADVLVYMDIDLSTNLESLIPLVDAIVQDGFDLAVGSRLLSSSRVIDRSIKREVLSRGYVFLIKCLFFSGITDAQCGFKAISNKAANTLMPLIEDNAWFLDTELLLLAERFGLKRKDIPIVWTDDPDSRVRIANTVLEDLKGLLRLRFGGQQRLQ